MLMRFLALGALVLVTGSATAQEKADNPDYANWSKFPKGTSVTRIWTSAEPDGRASVVTETITLMEVGADKLVLEEEFISDVPGAAKFKTKPKKRDVPKTVPLAAGSKPGDLSTKWPGAVEEGKEVQTVKVTGGEFKTRWIKTVVERGQSRAESKIWLSDEVPGRLVKADDTTSSNGKTYYTFREVVAVKKP